MVKFHPKSNQTGRISASNGPFPSIQQPNLIRRKQLRTSSCRFQRTEGFQHQSGSDVFELGLLRPLLPAPSVIFASFRKDGAVLLDQLRLCLRTGYTRILVLLPKFLPISFADHRRNPVGNNQQALLRPSSWIQSSRIFQRTPTTLPDHFQPSILLSL